MAHQRCWKTGQELAIGFFTREIKAPPPCVVAPHSPACATLRRANGGALCLSSFDRAATGRNFHREPDGVQGLPTRRARSLELPLMTTMKHMPFSSRMAAAYL